MNYHYNINAREQYRKKVEKDGFSVNIHTTMDKKKKQQTNISTSANQAKFKSLFKCKKQQTNISSSANNEKQDNKLLGNKRKIEDYLLLDEFDNKDLTKKNNSFYPIFNNNGYKNNITDNNFIFDDNEDEYNSIDNNLLLNDNVDKNNSIGNNNNVHNKSLFDLNCDKTVKGFGK